MTEPQPARDGAAVSRWLAEHHRHLITGIADTLDLEAGLRDIGITADHHALVSDVSDLLDLGVGLAAVLSTQEDPADPTIPESPSEFSSADTSTDLVTALAKAPAAVRLALRASVLDLTQAIDIISALDRAKGRTDILRGDLTHISARAIGRDLTTAHTLARIVANDLARARSIPRPRDPVHNLTHARARDLAHDLILAIIRARDLALARTHNIPRARSLARDLAYAIIRARDLALAHARDLAHNLAHNLGVPEAETGQIENLHTEELCDIVNDLIGADLHNVNLSGMRLDGVRWSDATRWPVQWVDRIKQDSVDLGDGIYEYRPGSSTIDGSLMLASR